MHAPRLLAVVTATVVAIGIAAPAMAASGDLDPSFDGDGMARTVLPGGSGTAENLLIQPDGTIVVAATQVGQNQGVAVVRYLPDGTPDPTFSGDGIATSSLRGVVTGLTRTRGGGLVVSVWSTTKDGLQSRFGLVRFLSDGTLDTRFGHHGRVTTTFGNASAIPWDVTPSKGGRLVAAGEITNPDGNEQDLALARYRADGRLDRSFGGDGTVRTAVKGIYATAWSVAAGQGGSIVVAGDGRSASGEHEHGLLASYRSDGRPSKRFSRDGVQLFPSVQAQRFNDVVLTNSGKILAAGDSNDASVVVRADTSGTLDRAFGSGGFAATSDAAFRTTFGLAVGANGAIVTVGDGVDDSPGTPRPVVTLVRYRANGEPDTTFGNGGTVLSDLGRAAKGGRAVAVQADGRIVVAVETQRASKAFRVLTARYLG